MNTAEFFTHEKALVDTGAKIGKGTRVWAFAHVMKGALIGTNCNIGNYAFVESGAILGNDVTVKNGVQVWEGVTAEDGVFLGPNCVFTNDMWPRSYLKPPKESWLEKTVLRKGCTVGANSTILCGIEIGAYAFVAAGALVTKNVPAHAIVKGSPARVCGWICVCAKKLPNHDGRISCGCGKSYRKEGERIVLEV